MTCECQKWQITTKWHLEVFAEDRTVISAVGGIIVHIGPHEICHCSHNGSEERRTLYFWVNGVHRSSPKEMSQKILGKITELSKIIQLIIMKKLFKIPVEFGETDVSLCFVSNDIKHNIYILFHAVFQLFVSIVDHLYSSIIFLGIFAEDSWKFVVDAHLIGTETLDVINIVWSASCDHFGPSSFGELNCQMSHSTRACTISFSRQNFT